MKNRTRREVMQDAGRIGAGAVLASLNLPSALAQMSADRIRFGVQLNAFPIDAHRFSTFLDSLAEVKQVGYQGFESSFRIVSSQFASPHDARRAIEQTGLIFFGIHIFLPTEQYDPATTIAPASIYKPIAKGGAALGAKHLILSGAPSRDEAQLKHKIAGLNAAGEYARSVGLTAAYHNHSPEFDSKIGEIEALYTQTDPSLVSFVLDAGHAYHGGADVPAFIRKHSRRIVGIHLRDYKDGRLVTLGTGTFPLAQVAATLKQIGWTDWVENEEERENHSQTGLEVIAPAYKAMKEAFAQ